MDVRCPKCGGKTRLRTRRKDGRKFYVCVNYPKCKGQVEHDEEWEDEQPKKRKEKPSRSKKPIIIVAAVIVSIIVIVVIVAIAMTSGDFGLDTSSHPTTATHTPTATHTTTPPSATFTITDFDQTFYESSNDYEVRVTLIDLIRGDEAWQMIHDANMFNDPPGAGFEYILAKVNFEFLSGPTSYSYYEVSPVWFDAVSSTGQDYDFVSVVLPNPSISTTLFDPGDSHEGWVSFYVSTSDTTPLMTFGRRFDSTGGIWFKLYESSDPATTATPGYSMSDPVGIGTPLSIEVGTYGVAGYDESWSDYVYVYFDVKNTGTSYLKYYNTSYTVTCADGSQYQKSAIGSDVFAGQTWPGWGICFVNGSKVASVAITDYELTAGTAPSVIYEITGSADTVDVTLNNATGGTSQYSDVDVPHKYAYSYFSDDFLYISAQNQGEYGSVTVKIYLNGALYKSSTSSGSYVIATASGSK